MKVSNHFNYIELDKELATLLNRWTDIQIVRQSNHHTELWGEDTNGKLCTIPRWTADDAEALRLVVEHEINLTFAADLGVSTYIEGDVEGKFFVYDEFPDKQTALRYAIVQATVSKLKG